MGEKIHKLLTDHTFAKNANKAREVYNDQPLTAAQRLAFAVNYTIRHKGAHHLTSHAALQLYWFQYYSLDVCLFLCVLVLILSTIMVFMFRCSVWCCISFCR